MCAAILVPCLVLTGEAAAQFNANQFGGADRANAARNMIIVGVQQGISSLPPTSGQSFEYEYDSSLGVMVPTETLGPTSFRSPQTLAPGKLAVRAAYSYFDLSQQFAPIQYLAEFQQPIGPDVQPAGIVGFGLDASAQVSLVNLGATYGLMDRLELTFNVPITVVDASANQLSSTRVSNATLPTNEAILSGVFQTVPLPTDPQARQENIDLLSGLYNDFLAPPDGPCTSTPENCLTYRSDSLEALGFPFNEGTNVGVGRISLGTKGQIYGGKQFDLAGSLEIFMPSPYQDEFAGSDTGSILPRLIGQVRLHPNFRWHFDVGYDYDFSESDLRRFVWNLGASVPVQRLVVDMGFGGSLFDTPLRWTPPTATGTFSGPTTSGQTIALTALGDTSLGDNYADFLFGIKYRVAEQTVLSGAVNVPITDDGFRAAAVGTVAAEVYF
jgi:hypothetical protein